MNLCLPAEAMFKYRFSQWNSGVEQLPWLEFSGSILALEGTGKTVYPVNQTLTHRYGGRSMYMAANDPRGFAAASKPRIPFRSPSFSVVQAQWPREEKSASFIPS